MPHTLRLPVLLLILTVFVPAVFVPVAGAEDWPQWMGTNRDGVVRETGIIAAIPAEGLPIKWRVPIAGGYSGPAVVDGKVLVFDYAKAAGEVTNNPGERVELSGQERLTALDAATGEQLWQHAYDCPYSISYPAGPRCTPTVHDGLVYSLGAEGDLRCLRVADGTLVWQTNLKEQFGVEAPIWGFASHPLVDGDLLYTMVGGDGQALVAFDRLTGEVRWKALSDAAGYCPPR